MANNFKPYRFTAILSIAAGMFVTSGCRTASVNAPTRNYPSGTAGPLPFFRSFERNPRTVEETDETPVPPDILPVPGYSEPALPVTPPVPPAPSAQKNRKSWLNSARRLSGGNSKAEKTEKVDQISNGSAGLGAATSMDEAESISPLPPEMPKLHSEAPGSLPAIRRMSTTAAAENQTSPHSEASGLPDITANPAYAPAPVKTRHGTISPWPYAKRAAVPQNSPNTPQDPSQNSKMTAPNTGERSAPYVGDVPFLLPPNN